MRIMSFNTWGGRVGEPLTQFIAKHGDDIDVFCLQEIFKEARPDVVRHLTHHANIQLDLFGTIARTLPNYQGIFCPFFKESFGVAMFVKKDIEVVETGDRTVYEGVHFLDNEHPDADHTRKIQWARLQREGDAVTIYHTHGHWVPGDKSDTRETVEQMQVILDTMKKAQCPQVLCGDLNVHPGTQSIRLLDEAFRNLVTEHDVASTRTELFSWPHHVVDYIFTSRDLEVKAFEVVPNVASDHAAIVAEIV